MKKLLRYATLGIAGKYQDFKDARREVTEAYAYYKLLEKKYDSVDDDVKTAIVEFGEAFAALRKLFGV